MQVADIMTTDVVSVQPDATVQEIAGVLLKHRISAVPVTGSEGQVVGIVSEGDLMRRSEIETAARHSWWLAEVLSPGEDPTNYIKTHGRKAADVMTRKVISVTADVPLREVAGLLERHHIKRVPVVRDGKLAGIISRANILQALAAQSAQSVAEVASDDQDIRENVLKELSKISGMDAPRLNVIVANGNVQLWGIVDAPAKKKAAQIAVENVHGVKVVENNLGFVPAWIYAD